VKPDCKQQKRHDRNAGENRCLTMPNNSQPCRPRPSTAAFPSRQFCHPGFKQSARSVAGRQLRLVSFPVSLAELGQRTLQFLQPGTAPEAAFKMSPNLAIGRRRLSARVQQ
jgi:hypothetical protein